MHLCVLKTVEVEKYCDCYRLNRIGNRPPERFEAIQKIISIDEEYNELEKLNRRKKK